MRGVGEERIEDRDDGARRKALNSLTLGANHDDVARSPEGKQAP